MEYNIESLAKQVEEELFSINKERIKQLLQKDSIQQDIEKLKILNQQLNLFIEEREASPYIRWSAILDNSYAINFNKVKNQKKEEFIKNKIFEGYKLTSLILQKLKIIKPISNVVSFIDDDYNYVRISEDFTFTVNMLNLNPVTSKEGADYYDLRLRANAFKDQIERAKANQKYEHINNHFRRFITPFLDWEARAVDSTKWKPNKGVLAETFQRHWEKRHMKYDGGPLDDDFGSVGSRWILYKKSSGSDPYFTGPDTDIAQVKNINASLISNVNTVVNTIKGVLQIVNENNLQKITEENLRKIFEQKQLRPVISKKIWESMDEKARKSVMEAIEEEFGENVQIRFTK